MWKRTILTLAFTTIILLVVGIAQVSATTYWFEDGPFMTGVEYIGIYPNGYSTASISWNPSARSVYYGDYLKWYNNFINADDSVSYVGEPRAGSGGIISGPTTTGTIAPLQMVGPLQNNLQVTGSSGTSNNAVFNRYKIGSTVAADSPSGCPFFIN